MQRTEKIEQVIHLGVGDTNQRWYAEGGKLRI